MINYLKPEYPVRLLCNVSYISRSVCYSRGKGSPHGVSQCFGMSLDLSCYAAGRALQRAAVIGLAGMSSEAAYATLQYFLGIGLRGQRLREHLRPHPLQEEGPPLLL